MAFTSLSFLALVGVALAVYCLVPPRGRWLVLLGASLIFYYVGGGWTIGYVLYTAAVTYGAGRLLGYCNGKKRAAPPEDRMAVAAKYKRPRRMVVLGACLGNFGLLYYLKYWGFTVSLLGSWGENLPVHQILLPLGLSFFMFQSIGYVVDVYRDKYPPQKNFLKFLLFVSFFPQMVQGPISRYDQLAPQLLAGRRPNCTDLQYGIQLALWGYFKKMVIADRAAVLVGTVMADPTAYNGAVLATGILFYCIQLYGDFSGGIDITRGVAKMFGIEMAENFRRPLFAASLADFWRRWHITLGGWMRDYVFYPLSLSKPFARLGRYTRKHIGGKLGKILPTSLATFIVYFIIGIWHGANWRYIAFGFWNGGWITLGLLLEPRFAAWKSALHIDGQSKWYRALQTLRTGFLVFLGRYITRAPRLLTGLWMMRETFVHPHIADLWNGTLLELGLSGGDMAVTLLGLSVVLAVEWYQEKGGHVRAALAEKNAFVQWLAIALPLLVLYCFGILRADYISSEFIYRQF